MTSKIDAALSLVPRSLASRVHVLGLVGLFVYLVVLPTAGVHVSNFAELVGGNYTNVTSDIAACIAAGGALLSMHHSRQAHQIAADTFQAVTGNDHPAAPTSSTAPSVNEDYAPTS